MTFRLGGLEIGVEGGYGLDDVMVLFFSSILVIFVSCSLCLFVFLFCVFAC